MNYSKLHPQNEYAKYVMSYFTNAADENLVIYQRYNSDIDNDPETLGDLEITHKVVLVAKWKPITYHVLLDFNDATTVIRHVDDKDIVNGSTEKFINTDDINNIYIEFDMNNWFNDRNGNNLYDEIKVGDETDDISYYFNEFRIDRYGYTFLGWSTKRFVNGEEVDSSQVIYDAINGEHYKLNFGNIDRSIVNSETASEITVYAVWRQNTYNLNILYDDDSQPNIYVDSNIYSTKKGTTSSSIYSETYTLVFDGNTLYLPTLTRLGYTFKGFTFGKQPILGNLTFVDDNKIFTSNSSGIVDLWLDKSTCTYTENDILKYYLFGTYNGIIDSEDRYDLEDANSQFNVYLYALWTPIKYNVTLNLGDEGVGYPNAYFKYESANVNNRIYGGTQDTISRVYEVTILFDTNNWNAKLLGSDYVASDTKLSRITLAKIGYTFDGWYTRPTGEDECLIYKDSFEYFNRDLHLTYPLDSGDIDDDAHRITIYAVWKTNYYNVAINKNEKYDTTSKAYYEYEGNYNGLRESVPEEYRVSVVFGSDYWLHLNMIKMDRYGFTWLGLYATDNETLSQNTKIEINSVLNLELYLKIVGYSNQLDVLNANIDSDGATLRIHALWQSNIYKINLSYYDSRTGHGSTWTSKELISHTQTITLGSKITFNGTLRRTGYDFVGWIVGTKDDTFIKDENKILSKYFINGVNNIINYEYLESLDNLKAINLYTKIGDKVELEKLGDSETNTDCEYEIYVYAYYRPIAYTIVLNRNDNSSMQGTTPAYFKISEYGDYTVTNIENITFSVVFDTNVWNNINNISIARYGYYFNGWYTKSGIGNTIDAQSMLTTSSPSNSNIFERNLYMNVYYNMYRETLNEETTASRLDADRVIDLYAGWKARTYDIVYVRDAGKVETKSELQDLLSANKLPLQMVFDNNYDLYSIFKPGYDFVGWSFSSYTANADENNGFIICNTSIIPVERDSSTNFRFGFIDSNDSTIYASYTNKDKNLLIYRSTEEGGQSQIYIYNASEKLIVNNTLIENKNLIIQDSVGLNATIERYGDGNDNNSIIYLYPVWKPKTFTIKFDLNDFNSENINGSTTAKISINNKLNYYYSYDEAVEAERNQLQEFFKEENYILNITMGASYKYKTYSHITTDRYGYTFMGWYYIPITDNSGVEDCFVPVTNSDSNEYINMLFALPASTSEVNYVFEEKIVSELIRMGILDRETNYLTLYARWKANTYRIDYITQAFDGSSDITKVSKTGESNKYQVHSSVTETLSIVFDTLVEFRYMRIGYEYEGFSFVNYAYNGYRTVSRDYIINEENYSYKCMFSWDYVHDDTIGATFLYTTSIGNISNIGEPEEFGDNEGENEHFVTLYLSWKAKQYSIQISLNTVKTNNYALDNYNSSDAGYNIIFGETLMFNQADNALLAYTTKNSRVTFTIYFDQNFEMAETKINNTTYRLKDLSILLTGYTYRTLNTNYDNTSSNNSVIVSGGVVTNNAKFNDAMFAKLYYQEATQDGYNWIITNTSYASTYVVNTNYIEISSYYNKRIFTLFAGYEKSSYSIRVGDDEYKTYTTPGEYRLINSSNFASAFTTARGSNIAPSEYLRQTFDFYLSENVLLIPSLPGNYLSKITLNSSYYTYEINSNNQFSRITNYFTLEITTKFDSANKTIVATSWVYTGNDNVSHVYIDYNDLIKEDEDINKPNWLKYVCNGLFIYPEYYDDNHYSLKTPLVENDVYLNAVDNINIVNLFIQNVKSNITIDCEFTPQKFDYEVYVSITDNDEIIIKDDNLLPKMIVNGVEKTQIEYGKYLYDITKYYDNMFGDAYDKLGSGWYLVHLQKDGNGNIIDNSISTEEIDLEDLNELNHNYVHTFVNQNIYLCYALKSNDVNPSKKIVFYTWQSDLRKDDKGNIIDVGSYTEFSGNNNYILQSNTFSYVYENVLTIEISGVEYYISQNKIFGNMEMLTLNQDEFTEKYYINNDTSHKFDLEELETAVKTYLGIPNSEVFSVQLSNIDNSIYIYRNYQSDKEIKEEVNNDSTLCTLKDGTSYVITNRRKLVSTKAGYIQKEDKITGIKSWDWCVYNNQNAFPTAKMDKDDETGIITSGLLSSLPNISSKYKGTETICYVILSDGDWRNINHPELDDPNSIYRKLANQGLTLNFVSDLKSENIYIRVTSIRDELDDDNNKTGRKFADIEFILVKYGEEIRKVAELEEVEVLTTSTLIDNTFSVFQAYSSIDLSMSDDMFYYEEKAGKPQEGTLYINESFEVTYFENSGNEYIFYSDANGNYLRYIVLNTIQYETFVQFMSKTSSISTALSDTINTYPDLEPKMLKYNIGEGGIITQKATNGYIKNGEEKLGYTIDFASGDYLFIFYYNNLSTETEKSIITTCDRCVVYDLNDKELRLYSTANNFAFTQTAVSADVIDEGALVRVNTDRMYTDYVDYNGDTYDADDINFVVLTQKGLSQYLENYADHYAEHLLVKEKALYDLIRNYKNNSLYMTIVNDLSSLTLSRSSYIMAYYEKDNEVVKVATNYVYVSITKNAVTSSLVYIQELMFTDDSGRLIIDDQLQHNGNGTYNYKLYMNTVYTDTFDIVSGEEFRFNNYDLNFIVMNGTGFKIYSDMVTNEFMNNVDALNYVIDNNSITHVVKDIFVATKNSFSITFTNLDYKEKYYILAYYKKGTSIQVVSSNTLVIITNNNTGYTFESNVFAISNNFSFTNASVNINDSTHTVSINENYVNKLYNNYATDNMISSDSIRYFALNRLELIALKSFMEEGILITNTTNNNRLFTRLSREEAISRGLMTENDEYTYTDITLEQALELVIYHYRGYRNDTTTYTSFINNLVNMKHVDNDDTKPLTTLNYLLDYNNYLPSPLYLVNNTYTLNVNVNNDIYLKEYYNYMTRDKDVLVTTTSGLSGTIKTIDYYIIGVSIKEPDRETSYATRFEKVTSNVVNIRYSINISNNKTSFGYEIVKLGSVIDI